MALTAQPSPDAESTGWLTLVNIVRSMPVKPG